MRHFFFVIPFLCLAVGCGSTPIEKAYTTRATFNQIVGSINSARAAHLIGDTEFDSLNDTYHDVAITLDDLDIAAVKAQASNTPILLNFDFTKTFNNAIREINSLATKWAAQRQRLRGNATVKIAA